MGFFDDIVPPDSASSYVPTPPGVPRITVRPKGVEPPGPGNGGGLFDDIVPPARSGLFDDIVPPPGGAQASDMAASDGGQFAAPLPDGRNFRVAREGISPPAGFADRLAAMWENPPTDRPSLIGLIKSAYEGATLAGDVYSGKTPITGPDGHTNPEVIKRAEQLAQVVPLRAAPGGIFARSPPGRVSNPFLKPETALSDEVAAAPRGRLRRRFRQRARDKFSRKLLDKACPTHAPGCKTAGQCGCTIGSDVSEARESGPSALEGKEPDAIRSGTRPPARPPDEAAAQSDRMKSGARESGPHDSGAPPAEAPALGSSAATENGGATFGTAGSKYYRTTFFKPNRELRGKVVVHHAVERQAMKKYPGVVTEAEMHSLENLRGIPRHLNSELHLKKIRREWNRFYEENPTATRRQLLQKATEIDAKYGSQFNPPIKSGR